MTNFNFIKLSSLIITCTILLCCANTRSTKNHLPDPTIKAGTVKVSGTIEDKTGLISSKIDISFYVPSVVTSKTNRVETEVKSDGSFYFELPTECSHSVGLLNLYSSEQGDHSIMFDIASDEEETKIEIIFEKNDSLKVNIHGGTLFTNYDAVTILTTLQEIMDHHSEIQNGMSKRVATSPNDFAERAFESLKYKLEIPKNNTKLSEYAKRFISNEFSFIMLDGRFLSYQDMMELDSMNNYVDFKREDYVAPPDPDISYYKFLKEFNLNNPQCLYNSSYQEVFYNLLNDKTLAIPRIGETPIDEWLVGVKATMSDLVGFNSGQFYDLMVSNSYARQFNDNRLPLSDKQIANIKSYFKGNEIEKILLRRNEETQKLAAEKSPLVVNEAPAVDKDKFMAAITSKFPSKVVVVDFWATWCSPCLKAMETMHPIKVEFKDKGVVFVYITNSTSPKRLWEDKAAGIGGEHYYLNGDQWYNLMNGLGFEAMPSYAIYDQNGKLFDKFTGYPGNDYLKTKLSELIP